MRPEELEDFVLENGILISKSRNNGKNVFIYVANDVYFKIESSPMSRSFDSIEQLAEEKAFRYFRNGDVRDLFYQKISEN